MNPAGQLVVGLNGSALLSPLTGIGQYTKNLAEHLITSGEVDLNIFYLARWSKEIRTEPFSVPRPDQNVHQEGRTASLPRQSRIARVEVSFRSTQSARVGVSRAKFSSAEIRWTDRGFDS